MASLHSSWRFGKKRSKLQLRIKVSQDPEDFYRLDPKKSAAENAYDIYAMLCLEETRDTKRLFLLNALASLCLAASSGSPNNNLRFSTEELLYCLSASLVHTFTQVRAAALRTIRYTLNSQKDIKTFNSLQLQHLLCRSIDLMLKNDDERVQALKLVRKMLAIAPEDISPVVVRCLVSLADSGIEESDNLLRACLATLAEFAVLNPALLIVCGGVTSITRNVLECHNPRIAESLCGVLLYLLEWPQIRKICGVRLDCLAAPYCDFTYRLGIMDKNKDARELRYTSCRLALLSVLRSWTGTLEFCDPSKSSGLKAIVDALYLNQIEVRKAILDLLYELLAVPQPSWTDDYTIALQTVDPSDFQDTWLLSNGFVSAEGRSILPSLAARAPNVVEQHLALLLYCFLETGLLNALVEVTVSSDQFVSVRSTILIGKIVQLMHTHLPADICSTSPALPTLVGHATQGNQQANAAVAALQNYQKMLRQRPASCSLFLDGIIQGGALIQTRLFRRNINVQDQTAALQMQDTTGAAAAAANVASSSSLIQSYRAGTATLDRPRLDSVSSSDESNSQASSSLRSSFRLKRKFLPQVFNLDSFRAFNRLLASSHVLASSDANAWDWLVVSTILRSNLIRKLDFSPGKFLNKFLKRLVDFFKPSNNRFSHQDLVPGQALPAYVNAGLDLIDVLLNSSELECMRYITDYFSDIGQHLLVVTTSSRAHDCLFSPQHMNNTMCQQYFLYIGRMCHSNKGIEVLKNTTVFEYLITLVRHTDHVCYVKLIVSGLNYSYEKLPRQVLEKALTLAKTRSGRLYATQFLTVLLRARLPNFEVWGLPLIIQQTKDTDRSVVLAAMDVLEEACHDKYYLEEIVSLWPNLRQLGDVGRLLMSRFYSLSRGLNSSKAHIEDEIKYWRNGYNKRYVLLVEADTHSSLTLHVRNEDGYYSRRNCNQRMLLVPPNIAPHLYGQMVQTTQGMTALRKHADLTHLLEILSRGKCNDDAECLELKASIWALCHASTHSNGIEYFVELGARLYEKLILLVTNCEVYSVRATCFSGLGLIAGTQAGANLLFKLNWLSVRHDRNTMWPVHQPEDWISTQYTPVRHHYEDMPPYNYTGIDDQIDGSYYTGSYWNLLLGGSCNNQQLHDVNTTTTTTTTTDSVRTTVEELPFSRPQTFGGVAIKSKTLPEGSNIRQGKHQRSLSESKTTDVISLLCGAPGVAFCPIHYQHRIRYNSCTDSNTSGVSSCESVTGRTAAAAAAANMSDFQQFPLSPIPSMSNLLELPTLDAAKLLRRTSLLGTSFLPPALSPLAIKGYAQLRSLRAHSRPVFSESAAELYDFIDIVDRAEVQPRKYSWGESSRRIKVRNLDRQNMLNVFTRLSSEQLQVPLPTLNAPRFLPANDLQGPCYAGICLPKNALDLFPTRNLNRTYVSCDIIDQDLSGFNLCNVRPQFSTFLNDSMNNDGGDESSVISSISDVSSSASRKPLKWQQGAKHARSQCLYCTRSRRQQRIQAQTSTHAQDINTNSGSLAPCKLYSSTTEAVVAAGMQAGPAGPAGPALACKTSSSKPNSSTMQLEDKGFHSPKSIISDESLPDKLTTSILYHVQRLANPVSAKQSKLVLLELKQKHPHAFQDICLYSESCKTLGRSSYRMSARRFLQELFLDLNFCTFYVEPQLIISSRKQPAADHLESTLAFVCSSLRSSSSSTIPASTAPTVTTAITAGAVPSTPLSATMSLLHKAQLKPKPTAPLASVYETSWENLLVDQSPRLNKNKTPEEAYVAFKLRTVMPNELHIDDATDDAMYSDDDDEDVCDGSGTDTLTSSCTTAHTTHPVAMSNRSSTCAINSQQQPLPSSNAEVPLHNTSCSNAENDNRQYTRGRFYTLELDLSCTKNKFPITDRNQTFTTRIKDQELARQISAYSNVSPDIGTELQYFNVTKSLAASMAKPVGSLYCEKRLQTSKSEAVLADCSGAIGNDDNI
ncbi:rapamycin-insensitive companion of mTOR isoform X2 [Drosophila innubila]|uniref:rapamycin-insensitive companion of mTOR isoform X2 n=1 Tax=Drosophila innubila TaxID=198719 RepID=UPI00148D02CF|nr:rapamycin-insensitive companion of mTOR isoform X2 [Drosophila innubila]